MNAKNLDKILEILKEIRYNDGSKPPKHLGEFVELLRYQNYYLLLNDIKTGKIVVNIPNHMLYGDYYIVVPPIERSVNSLLVFIPWIVSICLCIYGIIHGNYWLLLSLPTVVSSQYLSSFIGGGLTLFTLLAGSIYFFTTGRTILGMFSAVIFTTMFFGQYFRKHRRTSILKAAMSHESIFCFLYNNCSISLIDTRTNEFIQAGRQFSK